MKAALTAIALLVVCVIAAVAALGSGENDTPATAREVPPAEVQGAKCQKFEMEAAVETFLAAANSGDEAQLRQSIAPAKRFQAFSEFLSYRSPPPPSKFFVTKKRRQLIAHLLSRYEKGDRTELTEMAPAGYDSDFDHCEFSFILSRQIAGGPWRSSPRTKERWTGPPLASGFGTQAAPEPEPGPNSLDCPNGFSYGAEVAVCSGLARGDGGQGQSFRQVAELASDGRARPEPPGLAVGS